VEQLLAPSLARSLSTRRGGRSQQRRRYLLGDWSVIEGRSKILRSGGPSSHQARTATAAIRARDRSCGDLRHKPAYTSAPARNLRRPTDQGIAKPHSGPQKLHLSPYTSNHRSISACIVETGLGCGFWKKGVCRLVREARNTMRRACFLFRFQGGSGWWPAGRSTPETQNRCHPGIHQASREVR